MSERTRPGTEGEMVAAGSGWECVLMTRQYSWRPVRTTRRECGLACLLSRASAAFLRSLVRSRRSFSCASSSRSRRMAFPKFVRILDMAENEALMLFMGDGSFTGDAPFGNMLRGGTGGCSYQGTGTKGAVRHPGAW